MNLPDQFVLRFNGICGKLNKKVRYGELFGREFAL